jgi:fibrillarin-like rRNA methylase
MLVPMVDVIFADVAQVINSPSMIPVVVADLMQSPIKPVLWE